MNWTNYESEVIGAGPPVGGTLVAVHTSNFSLFEVGENLTDEAFELISSFNGRSLLSALKTNKDVHMIDVVNGAGWNDTIRFNLRTDGDKGATRVSFFAATRYSGKFFGMPGMEVCRNGSFVESAVPASTKLGPYTSEVERVDNEDDPLRDKTVDNGVAVDNNRSYGTVSLERGAFDRSEISDPFDKFRQWDCFPGDSKVLVEGGAMKRIDEIQIGDRVAVGGGTYSEVFMLTHKLEQGVFEFVAIRTACGRVIRLTRGHYLPLNGVYKRAGEAVAGDKVYLEDGAVSTVVDVRVVSGVGLFNLQTMHGDIVVDGVRASTYTEAVERNMAHAMLAPLRFARDRLGLRVRLFEAGVGSLTRVQYLLG